MTSTGRLSHDKNVTAAAAGVITDRIRSAVEAATGAEGASATALTALLGWADGRHIDALAAGLRLSHSRAVRVVDLIESRGLAERRTDPQDGRRALITLTEQGRRVAIRARGARAEAVEALLDAVPAADLATVARASEILLRAQVSSRAEARAICRMCDVTACGHADGGCPSTAGADAIEVP